MFLVKKSQLKFRNEEDVLFNFREYGSFEYKLQLHHLSNGEFVFFYRKTLYHFDRDQVLLNSLLFDRNIRTNFYKPCFLKLRDDTILFFDRTKRMVLTPENSCNFKATLSIYDPKTKTLSLQIETDYLQFYRETGLDMLELKNGNIVIVDKTQTIYVCDRRTGRLLVFYPNLSETCDQDESIYVENPFSSIVSIREIGENKLLCASNLCHYVIIDLATNQKTFRQIDLAEIRSKTRFDFKDRELVSKLCFVDFYIMNDHTFSINFKLKGIDGIDCILYDFDKNKVLGKRLHPLDAHYFRVGANLFFYMRLRHESYFLDARWNTLHRTNMYLDSQDVLCLNESEIIVVDSNNCISRHELYYR
jgi:hypothetical protein